MIVMFNLKLLLHINISKINMVDSDELYILVKKKLINTIK